MVGMLMAGEWRSVDLLGHTCSGPIPEFSVLSTAVARSWTSGFLW